MFETQKSGNGMYVAIAAALCFIAGYALATYRANTADVKITTNQDGAVLISYKQTPPRELRAQHGVVIVGSVRERLEDLLHEEPQTIRRLTQESLRR